MPIIEVNILEGREAQTKRELIAAITQVAVEVLKAPPEAVRVLIREYPKMHWGVAGVPKP